MLGKEFIDTDSSAHEGRNKATFLKTPCGVVNKPIQPGRNEPLWGVHCLFRCGADRYRNDAEEFVDHPASELDGQLEFYRACDKSIWQ